MHSTSDITTPTVEPHQDPAVPRPRISALEGLRGLAVVAVMLFHDDRLAGGFLGVDLFFVLSGFLITGLLIDEKRRNGAVALARFWSRRARRLLPALLVMVAAVVPLMYWLGSPGQLKSARDGAFPAIVYLSNWQQIGQGTDYWALFSDPSPMTHLWSLAVEGQFYIVWPVVFVVVARLRRWRLWLGVITLVGITLSAAALMVLFDPINVNRAYIGSDTRVSAILLGALAAIVGLPAVVERAAQRRPRLMASSTEVLHVVLVAALAWSWYSIDGQGSGLYRGGMLAHSAAAAILISTVGLQRTTLVQRALSWRLLTAIGAISYSLYLWHWPVYLVLTKERVGTDGLALSLLRWSVSLAAAMASYWLVETPIRHRRWLTTPRSSFVCIVGSVAVLGLIVVAVPRPETAPLSFDAGSITIPTAITSPTSSVQVSTASTNDTTATGVTVSAQTTVPVTTPTLARRTVSTVLWEGDSVAYDAAPGVVAALIAAGLEAQPFAAPGTGLVDPSPGVSALKFFGDPILAQRPDLVIFQLSGWDERRSMDEQRAAFTAYTDLVLDSGASLIFVTPPPVDPSKLISGVAFMQSLAEALAAEDPARVAVWDSAALWGPFAYDINGDGVPERKPDGVHICPQGSALLGAWLTQQLALSFDGVTPALPSEWAGGDWVNEQRFDNPLGACA